jgi:hypothetical protein
VISEKKIGGSSVGTVRSEEDSCRAAMEKCLENLHQNFHYEAYRTRTLRTRQNLWKTIPAFDSRALTLGFSKVNKLFRVSSCFWQYNSQHIIVILIILAAPALTLFFCVF